MIATLDEFLTNLPFIAILRGVRPHEVVEIAGAIREQGIRAIEVPLNSPDPFESIERLADAFGSDCLCGAGTVLDPASVDATRKAGGTLIVTPNVDTNVIRHAVASDMTVVSGCATATEAFSALSAGAHGLKLFPAAAFGPAYLQALRDVLPDSAGIFPVGGVGPESISPWLVAGARGFGFGSALYRPGDSALQAANRARVLADAFRHAMRTV